MATHKKRGRPPGSKNKSSSPEPSVARAASKVTGDGAPPGEKPGPMSSAERTAKYREGKKATPKAEVLDLTVTDGDVEAAAAIGDVLWDMVGPVARCGPLNGEQKTRLGKALAPLIKKYMPLLGDWQHECAAVLCIMALARETHVPKEDTPQGGDDDGDRVEAPARVGE